MPAHEQHRVEHHEHEPGGGRLVEQRELQRATSDVGRGATTPSSSGDAGRSCGPRRQSTMSRKTFRNCSTMRRGGLRNARFYTQVGPSMREASADRRTPTNSTPRCCRAARRRPARARHRVHARAHLSPAALPGPDRDRDGLLPDRPARGARPRAVARTAAGPPPKLKILHAARQDLEVLLLAGGAVPGSALRYAGRGGAARVAGAGRLCGTGRAPARTFDRQGPDAHGLVEAPADGRRNSPMRPTTCATCSMLHTRAAAPR